MAQVDVAFEILTKTRVNCPGCHGEEKLEDVIVGFKDRAVLVIADCHHDRCATSWRRVDVKN